MIVFVDDSVLVGNGIRKIYNSIGITIRAVKTMIVVDGDSVGECKWSVRRYEE